MAILVARMVKMKAGNLHGMQRHNQRETEAHSNKEIDNEKSYLNYDLVNQKPINYKDKVNQIIETTRTSKKVIRKDAVLCDEWIITSQHEFFKGADSEYIEDFFKTTCDYFKERCGSENIVYGTVHMDETTPHMHLGIVPMVDGRLSSKDVFSRASLLEIQNELPKYLQSHNFIDIHRGQEESKRKHLSVPEYKQVQNSVLDLKKECVDTIKKSMELEKMSSKLDEDVLRKMKQYGTVNESIDILNKKYENSDWAQKNILSVAKEKIGFDKKKKYIFSEEEMDIICKKVNELNHSSRSNDDLRKQNEKLVNENFNLHSSIPNLINERTEKLSNQNEKLSKERDAFEMVYNNAANTKTKVLQDCKKIIFNTELYLSKYLNIDEVGIEAYKCYLSMDKEMKLPKFYELDGMGSEEVIDEAINIYNKVDLKANQLQKENDNSIRYSKYNDFELEL